MSGGIQTGSLCQYRPKAICDIYLEIYTQCDIHLERGVEIGDGEMGGCLEKMPHSVFFNNSFIDIYHTIHPFKVLFSC